MIDPLDEEPLDEIRRHIGTQASLAKYVAEELLGVLEADPRSLHDLKKAERLSNQAWVHVGDAIEATERLRRRGG